MANLDKQGSTAPSRASSLSTVTQIAEIVASLAVLVTLLFLIVEIRQNTETTRVASYDRSIELLNEWRLTVAENPDLSAYWVDYIGRGGGDMSTEADVRLNMVVGTLWGVYENAYFANERGFLGPSEWSRFEVQLCRQHELAAENGRWDGSRSPSVSPITGLLTSEFVGFVESHCAT